MITGIHLFGFRVNLSDGRCLNGGLSVHVRDQIGEGRFIIP